MPDQYRWHTLDSEHTVYGAEVSLYVDFYGGQRNAVPSSILTGRHRSPARSFVRVQLRLAYEWSFRGRSIIWSGSANPW
jgi:hypothetical protein